MKKIIIVKKGVTAKEVAKNADCCTDSGPTKVR